MSDAASHLEIALGKSFGPHFTLDVSLSCGSEVVCLFGPSGAGKSTVLDCIAGLQTPDTGRITLAGRSLFDSTTGTSIAPASRRLGYVFQNLSLFPHMTARQNVGFGLRSLPGGQRNQRVAMLLARF